MKKYRLVIALLFILTVLSGCAGTDDLLSGSGEDFLSDLNEFEQTYDGDIPQSVLDTLDFMLKNFTEGVSNYHEEYDLDDMDDDEGQKIEDELDDRLKEEKDDDLGGINDNIIDSEQEFIEFMVAKLNNKEDNIACKVNSSLYSNKFVEDAMFIDIGGNYVIETMYYNSYMLYCRDGGAYVDIMLDIGYNFPENELTRMREATDKKADEIVKRLGLNDPSKSDYEKIRLVNEYLCDTVVYSAGNPPYEPIQHTAYGALLNGDCVCEGYTKAANLIFSKCGIESYYVLGAVENPNDHCWNIVKVDGQYYQLDITWNDTDGYPNQFFLVTDDYMSMTRSWEKNKYPKVANRPYTN